MYLPQYLVVFFLQICVQYCIDVVAVVEINSIKKRSACEPYKVATAIIIHEDQYICQQEPLYHNFTYLDWWPRDGATDWDDESGRDGLLTNVVKDHQGMTGIRAPHDTA